ncbi:MAG TPA: hypothetical protein VF185_02145 [Patescibacteria group bacterium]
MSDFERARHRLQQKAEESQRRKLEETETEKIFQETEQSRLKNEAEQLRLDQEGLEARKKILPAAQLKISEFLSEINAKLFLNKGAISGWRVVEDLHDHTTYYEEGMYDNYCSWSETEHHKSKQLVTSLHLDANQSLFFSIPVMSSTLVEKEKFIEERDWLMRKTGVVFSDGYEKLWEDRLALDKQLGQVSLGGEKCYRETARVPISYYNEEERKKLFIAGEPIVCRLPLKGDEWNKFRELVLYYIAEELNLPD